MSQQSAAPQSEESPSGGYSCAPDITSAYPSATEGGFAGMAVPQPDEQAAPGPGYGQRTDQREQQNAVWSPPPEPDQPQAPPPQPAPTRPGHRAAVVTIAVLGTVLVLATVLTLALLL